MKKRILSLTLVMVMLLSTVPVPVYAENLGNGSAEAPWQIGDTVTNDGAAAPEGTTAENSYWERTDVPAAATVVCQNEEHDHTVSGCEEIFASTDCLLEGHPTEGEETSFTHEDGTVCTYDAENNKWLTAMAAGFSCGLEAHTHTVEAGCIEESAAYTLWTLTENPAPAPDKLLASVPAPSAEGDSKTGLPVHFFLAAPGDITNPEGSYTNYYGPAGSGYNSWDGGESNLKVWDDWGVLYDQIAIRNVTDESIVTQYIASWPHGLSEAAFKNFGSVTIRVGWRNVTYTSDQYEIKWVNVMARNNADPDTALRCQQRNFEGDHIHVDGLLVEKIQPGEMQVFKAIPEAVESATTFQFTLEKLQQANLTVPPTSDAVDTSFPAMTLTATIPAGSTEAHVVGGSDISFGYYKLTENVNPNWVPNGITMTDGNNRTQTDNDANTLYIAIAPNGDVLYSTAVTGPYYTMSKVAMLNKRQNVNVTYQWRIYDEAGVELGSELPTDLAVNSKPAAASVEPGTNYVYDTEFVEGTTYYDYTNGKIYAFHGWDTWSHSSAFNVVPTAQGYYPLDDGDVEPGNNAPLPITADTWINGYWVVSNMTPADAYLMLDKDVAVVGGDDDDAAYVEDYLRNVGRMFIRVDPGIDNNNDGISRIDVDYPAIAAEGGQRINVYQYDAPFEFVEFQSEIPGYAKAVTVTVSENSNLTLTSASGDEAVVTISPEYEPEPNGLNLGTVTYLNTYTKKTGDAITVYPKLTLVKRASDTGLLQKDAVFTVYGDAACTDVLGTVSTGGDGTAGIDFAALMQNSTGTVTFYLRETAAPAGYLLDSSIYTLTLTPSTKEELRNGVFVEITSYTLSIAVPTGSTAAAVQNAEQGESYSLNVQNSPILGTLTVHKEAVGLEPEDIKNLEAAITVHGPLSRDEEGNITALGGEYGVYLDEENEWQSTLPRLPIGEYLIHENSASVHGYTWDMDGVNYGNLPTVFYNGITSGLFEITADNIEIDLTITNTYAPWTVADFAIRKTNPGGAPLGNASFRLYYDEGCTRPVVSDEFTTAATTAANGYAWFSGYTVPDGSETVTYYLRETRAPAGYYLSDVVYKVDIKAIPGNVHTTYEPKISVKVNGQWETSPNFSNTSDELRVVNELVKGRITIEKTMNGAPTNLKEVSFYVSGPNDYHATVTLRESDGWVATLENLTLGTYTIVEQSADAPGYDLVTSYTVGDTVVNDMATVTLSEIRPGETASGTVFVGEVEISNTYTIREETIENPASLHIRKVGENNEPLSGAVFGLTDKSGHTATFTTNANGEAVFYFLYGSLQNGTALDGTYTLREITPPAGYAATDTVWTVTVKEEDGEVFIKLDEKNNIWQNIWDWIIGGVDGEQESYSFADNVLTVKNNELAELTIHKSFAADVTPPEGAVIEVAVYDDADTLVEQVKLSEANEWEYTLENLNAGTYTVRETSPSIHGYRWDNAGFAVTGATAGETTNNSVRLTLADSANARAEITNSYTAWESVDFYVLKTGEDGNTPLSGAAFKLFDANGVDVTGNYLHIDKDIHTNNGNVTGSGGILHFQGFEVDEGETKNFTLKETQAPVNYYANGNTYRVAVTHDENGYDLAVTDENGGTLTFDDDKAAFNHGSDVLTVVNKEITADLVIRKSFGRESVLALNAVRVDVTGPNGYRNTVTLGTGNQFTATLKDLPLGNYTVQEQDASRPGYDLSVTYNGQVAEKAEVKLTTEDDTTAKVVAIENTYTIREETVENPGSLHIRKVGENNEPLSGAVFELKDADGKTTPLTTNENGEVVFDFLKGSLRNGTPLDGTYTLSETTPPAGYAATDTIWTVTVTENDGYVNIKLDEQNNVWQNIWDWIIGGVSGAQDSYTFANNLLTVKNYELADLTIHKNFAAGVTPPEGAIIEVAVYDAANSLVAQLELSTENQWTHKLENLSAGTYTVRESSPSLHGYQWEKADFTVTDAARGESTNNSVLVTIANSADARVEISNSYTAWETVDFYVLKTREDGDTPLSGAAFRLFDANGVDVTDTYLHVDESIHTNSHNVTGSGGVLHFRGFEVDEGEKKVFTLMEIQAPTNYYKNDNVYYITVSHDNSAYDVTITDVGGNALTIADDKAAFNHGNDVLTVVNEEITADLVIKKSFSDDSALELDVVYVDVSGPNGYKETVTLNESDGFECTLTNLSLGTYTVQEKDASRPGYDLTVKYNQLVADKAEVELTVNDDTTAKIVAIENTYKKNEEDIHNPASFTVKKVDALTGAPLQNAVFGLYDADGNLVGDTKISGEDGKVTFGPFRSAAEYTLKEVAAPANYHATDATWSVEVQLKNGQAEVQLNQNENLFENIYNWIVDLVTNGQINSSWENNVLTVPNVKKTGSLTITKRVTDPEGLYADAEYDFLLDASDDAFDQTFALKAGESKTVENIPWGTAYTLTEDRTNAAFTTGLTDSGNGCIQADETTVTVINTYVYQENKPSLNLMKVDADSAAPIANVTFELFSDTDCRQKVGEGTSDSNGKLSIDVDYGTATYYLREKAPATGYHPNEDVYTVTAETRYVVKNAGEDNTFTEKQLILKANGLDGFDEATATYTVKNTAIKPLTIQVSKVWDDGGYHARPESISAVLYRDDIEYERVTLNEENEWKHSWSGAAYTDAFKWTVDEAETPEEYGKVVTNEGENWTITNKRDPRSVEISVTKAWNHNGGRELPDSIKVTLYRNGTRFDEATLNAANNWSHTWSGADFTDAAVWSVDETEIPTGYTREVSANGYTFTITNTRTINPVEVSVKKVWVASEGVKHPESTEAVLYRDGTAHETVRLDATNNWSHTWSNLTDEYTWTVDEKEVPAGYTKSVTNTGHDYTITNTKDFKYINVSVSKLWYGNGGKHPASVTVTLLRDGQAVDNVTLSAANDWRYIWTNLTDEFEWKVDELSVPSSYNKSVRVYNDYNFIVTNTHVSVVQSGDDSNRLDMILLGLVGMMGFVFTTIQLFAPRKKGKHQH